MKLNKPVFLNALRCLGDAPVRLVITGLLLLIFYAFAGGGMTVNGNPITGLGSLVTGGNSLLLMILWLLGLGLISRDISGGSIQLVLLRPLSRNSYVLSKWASLASVGLAVLVFIHLAFLVHHGLDGAGAGPEGLALLFAAQVIQVAAAAAVITLFSTVPMQFGELGLLILCAVLMAMLKVVNLRLGLPALDQALDAAWRVLLPKVTYSPTFVDKGTGDLLAGLAVNAGVAVAGLAGAMALLARREFSYAESA